jgi:hypothetical protein
LLFYLLTVLGSLFGLPYVFKSPISAAVQSPQAQA